MAYSFNGTNQYLRVNSWTEPSKPITISARLRASAVSRFNTAVDASTATSVGVNRVLRTTNTNTIVAREFTGAGGDASVAGPVVINTWYVLGGQYISTTDRRVFWGSSTATNTTTTTSSATNTLSIGASFFNSAMSSPHAGDLAEIAIWSAQLTAAEMESLNKGFKPTRIRPQSLVFYAPMIREAIDIRNGNTLTNNNGATASNHPRVY